MGKRSDNPLLHASAKSNVGHEAPRNQARTKIENTLKKGLKPEVDPRRDLATDTCLSLLDESTAESGGFVEAVSTCAGGKRWHMWFHQGLLAHRTSIRLLSGPEPSEATKAEVVMLLNGGAAWKQSQHFSSALRASLQLSRSPCRYCHVTSVSQSHSMLMKHTMRTLSGEGLDAEPTSNDLEPSPGCLGIPGDVHERALDWIQCREGSCCEGATSTP